jgi:hypothetical protein
MLKLGLSSKKKQSFMKLSHSVSPIVIRLFYILSQSIQLYELGKYTGIKICHFLQLVISGSVDFLDLARMGICFHQQIITSQVQWAFILMILLLNKCVCGSAVSRHDCLYV